MAKKINYKIWIFLLLISGLIWWSDGQGWWNWLKRPLATITQPVRAGLFVFKSKVVGNQQSTGNNKEVAVLNTKLGLVEAELILIQEENQQMSDLLGAKLPADWQLVPAMVLGINQQMMTIAIGTDQGIKKGEMVICLTDYQPKTGMLLGRVSEVSAVEAQVKMLSHPDILVTVRTSTGALGMVAGKGDQGLQLEKVLQKYHLNESDLITTVGGDDWRPGLVVGRVGKITKTVTAIYQQAEVEQLIELSSQRRVVVIKSADF